WLSCCCSQSLTLCHNSLTVECGILVARKFHGWTYCTGGNLSRYHN
ncbi:unnamed protein product, partial [Staurois parvus]